MELYNSYSEKLDDYERKNPEEELVFWRAASADWLLYCLFVAVLTRVETYTKTVQQYVLL